MERLDESIARVREILEDATVHPSLAISMLDAYAEQLRDRVRGRAGQREKSTGHSNPRRIWCNDKRYLICSNFEPVTFVGNECLAKSMYSSSVSTVLIDAALSKSGKILNAIVTIGGLSTYILALIGALTPLVPIVLCGISISLSFALEPTDMNTVILRKVLQRFDLGFMAINLLFTCVSYLFVFTDRLVGVAAFLALLTAYPMLFLDAKTSLVVPSTGRSERDFQHVIPRKLKETTRKSIRLAMLSSTVFFFIFALLFSFKILPIDSVTVRWCKMLVNLNLRTESTLIVLTAFCFRMAWNGHKGSMALMQGVQVIAVSPSAASKIMTGYSKSLTNLISNSMGNHSSMRKFKPFRRPRSNTKSAIYPSELTQAQGKAGSRYKFGGTNVKNISTLSSIFNFSSKRAQPKPTSAVDGGARLEAVLNLAYELVVELDGSPRLNSEGEQHGLGEEAQVPLESVEHLAGSECDSQINRALTVSSTASSTASAHESRYSTQAHSMDGFASILLASVNEMKDNCMLQAAYTMAKRETDIDGQSTRSMVWILVPTFAPTEVRLEDSMGSWMMRRFGEPALSIRLSHTTPTSRAQVKKKITMASKCDKENPHRNKRGTGFSNKLLKIVALGVSISILVQLYFCSLLFLAPQGENLETQKFVVQALGLVLSTSVCAMFPFLNTQILSLLMWNFHVWFVAINVAVLCLFGCYSFVRASDQILYVWCETMLLPLLLLDAAPYSGFIGKVRRVAFVSFAILQVVLTGGFFADRLVLRTEPDRFFNLGVKELDPIQTFFGSQLVVALYSFRYTWNALFLQDSLVALPDLCIVELDSRRLHHVQQAFLFQRQIIKETSPHIKEESYIISSIDSES